MGTGQDNGFKPRPRIAITTTGVVVGLAIEDQVTSGSIDPALIGGLLFLVAFWAGQGVDLWRGR